MKSTNGQKTGTSLYGASAVIIVLIFCLFTAPAAAREADGPEKEQVQGDAAPGESVASLQQLSEGQKPYSPSRLRWLCLELNALYGSKALSRSGYTITYIPKDALNTVMIMVQYAEEANMDVLNQEIENAQDLVRLSARSYGWDSWLKINVARYPAE